jgi:DNA-binding transcriptional LysR family regulator
MASACGTEALETDSMDETAWDELQLFLHVATAGGLSAAAACTGISAPTIGRRMLALEKSLGRSLFLRSQQGYRLAHDGEILLQHVRDMQAASAGIANWRFRLPIVTIAGDSWTAGFMADHIDALRTASDAFRLCCHDGIDDLAFRRIDVALLPERPSGGNLAALRSVTLRYAVYEARREPEAPAGRWISIATERARGPAERWVFEHHEAEIATWTTSFDLLHRLVRSGAGRSLLPVFAGDADPMLRRVGAPVSELDHALFIVSHDDERHRPEVRLVIERLAALLKDRASLFCGQAVAAVA